MLLFPSATPSSSCGDDAIECKERLGGMLKYYYREAAQLVMDDVLAKLRPEALERIEVSPNFNS